MTIENESSEIVVEEEIEKMWEEEKRVAGPFCSLSGVSVTADVDSGSGGEDRLAACTAYVRVRRLLGDDTDDTNFFTRNISPFSGIHSSGIRFPGVPFPRFTFPWPLLD